MDKLRTMATVALMAGLVGGTLWVAGPGNKSQEAAVTPIPRLAKCRPHDDCARMKRAQRKVIEANVSP